MKKIVALILVVTMGCSQPEYRFEETDFQQSLANGDFANEGYRRCLNFVNDWLEHADPETGLIPRNLMGSKDIWNAQDAAADNYPFMVLTAAILDRELFEGRMHDMLETEQRITNRLDRLPDTYSFSKKGFADEVANKTNIIFGASEYVKDGLLPLTEYLGVSPWSERMTGLVDDIWKHAEYETPFGTIPSLDVEVNGELLQALSRIFRMTGDKKYLDWAIRLGDYYLLGNNHPTKNLEIIRLRDHGCEIVSGLCELYLVTAFDMPEKREEYREPVYEMLNRILEVGTNEHGLFYNQVNPVSGEILNSGIADTYGYTYNAFYSVYLLDNHLPYRDAVLKALGNLNHYTDYNWETQSSDGFADAIESALNLYNRERIPAVGQWVESEIRNMWSIQDTARREGLEEFRGSGIIEGWHGDGNFARTTIMFCLWKTQGITMIPWNETLVYGAEIINGEVRLAITSDKYWEGKLIFDIPRHREIFDLPLDYPRINQFPEWFTVDKAKKYKVINLSRKVTGVYSGDQLSKGIELKIDQGDTLYLAVNEI